MPKPPAHRPSRFSRPPVPPEPRKAHVHSLGRLNRERLRAGRYTVADHLSWAEGRQRRRRRGRLHKPQIEGLPEITHGRQHHAEPEEVKAGRSKVLQRENEAAWAKE